MNSFSDGNLVILLFMPTIIICIRSFLDQEDVEFVQHLLCTYYLLIRTQTSKNRHAPFFRLRMSKTCFPNKSFKVQKQKLILLRKKCKCKKQDGQGNCTETLQSATFYSKPMDQFYVEIWKILCGLNFDSLILNKFGESKPPSTKMNPFSFVFFKNICKIFVLNFRMLKVI